MAALVWFVNLSYAWSIKYQLKSTRRDSVNSKVAYFHLSAWSIPLMLTITILALGEVDGDSLRGICFVGSIKPIVRFLFVLVPASISLFVGCYFLSKAMISLIKVKILNKQHDKDKERKKSLGGKVDNMIYRIGNNSELGSFILYNFYTSFMQLLYNFYTSFNTYCFLFSTAFFMLFAISSLICTFICHLYEFINFQKWKKSLDDYIM
jgi:smoothened protein